MNASTAIADWSPEVSRAVGPVVDGAASSFPQHSSIRTADSWPLPNSLRPLRLHKAAQRRDVAGGHRQGNRLVELVQPSTPLSSCPTNLRLPLPGVPAKGPPPLWPAASLSAWWCSARSTLAGRAAPYTKPELAAGDLPRRVADTRSRCKRCDLDVAALCVIRRRSDLPEANQDLAWPSESVVLQPEESRQGTGSWHSKDCSRNGCILAEPGGFVQVLGTTPTNGPFDKRLARGLRPASQGAPAWHRSKRECRPLVPPRTRNAQYACDRKPSAAGPPVCSAARKAGRRRLAALGAPPTPRAGGNQGSLNRYLQRMVS